MTVILHIFYHKVICLEIVIFFDKKFYIYIYKRIGLLKSSPDLSLNQSKSIKRALKRAAHFIVYFTKICRLYDIHQNIAYKMHHNFVIKYNIDLVNKAAAFSQTN